MQPMTEKVGKSAYESGAPAACSPVDAADADKLGTEERYAEDGSDVKAADVLGGRLADSGVAEAEARRLGAIVRGVTNGYYAVLLELNNGGMEEMQIALRAYIDGLEGLYSKQFRS